MNTADRIEQYINRTVEQAQNRSEVLFMFADIASALGLDERKVQSYLHGYAGASDNAIVVRNSDRHDPH